MKILISLFITLLTLTTPLSAQRTINREGQIDRSFGINGIATTPGEHVHPYGYWPVLVTPSQHVFHTYDIYDIWIHGFRIVKQRPDGTLDTSFGEQGVRTLDFTDGAISDAGIWALGWQADGKLLVAAGTRSGTLPPVRKAFIMRLMQNGEIDTTFGDQGRVEVNFTSPHPPGTLGSYVISEVLVDAQGGIIVAAMAAAHTTSGVDRIYAILTRLTASGQIDRTFAQNGELALHVGEGSGAEVTIFAWGAEIRILPDGKIVWAFTSCSEPAMPPGGFPKKVLMMRFLPNGSLDTSFSDDGIAQLNRYSYGIFARFWPLANGDYLVRMQEGLLRLKSDGTPDTTFGYQGYNNFMGGMESSGLSVADDGKILLSDYQYVVASQTYQTRLRRYWPDGTPDIRFGHNGLVTHAIGQGFYLRILAQPDPSYFIAMCITGNSVPCTTRISAKRKL